MSILSIDIGTSSCKCTIMEEEGLINSSVTKTYPLCKKSNGYIELNPHDVWRATRNSIKEAVKENPGSEVTVICITSFGEAGVLINKNGDVLYNSMLYSDPRGEQQCKVLTKTITGLEIMKITGHNPAPMYSAPKLMWIKENEPVIYKEIYKFLQYSSFVLYKLSRETKEDYSLCSRTLMFDVKQKQWSEQLLSIAQLDIDVFPEAVKSGTISGEISKTMAKELGIRESVKIVLCGQDQITAALGSGVINSGMAVNGMGSVDCITPILSEANINSYMEKYNYCMVPFVVNDYYATYAFNFAGGSLIKWYDEILTNENYNNLNQNIPDEPTGMFVLPHIMGASTPYMDADSTGAIIGVDISTDKYDLYKAMIEGIAYEAKTNLDCLSEAGIEVKRLVACGGGSKSEQRIIINADIFGIPIDILEHNEAGLLGSAILGGVAVGIYKDIDCGINQLIKIKKTIYPNSEKYNQYSSLYQKYKKVYSNVKDIMN